jgi:hypothetical protein
MRTVDGDKTFTASNLRELSKDLGICYTTAVRVANKKENCVTAKYITIDRVPRVATKRKISHKFSSATNENVMQTHQ